MHKSWTDYYPNVDIPFTDDQFYSGLTFNSEDSTLTPTKGNTYVYNCYFSDMHSEGNGGAILYSISNSNLLVEKCSIYHCKATGYRAGIRVTQGNCIIAFVCSQKGYSNDGDSFCSITNEDPSREINSVFDSSISHCDTTKDNTIYHAQGHVYIKSVNLSHNKAKSCSALNCNPNKVNEETKHGSDIIYCSFSNNTAKNQYCIMMNNEFNEICTYELKNCNIIDNISPKTIWSQGETKMTFCSIMNNVNPCFFTETSETSESSITLVQCYTDSKNGENSNSFIETETRNPFLNAITFYSTGQCENFFIHIRNPSKCETLSKHIFNHKLFLHYLFIFILIES